MKLSREAIQRMVSDRVGGGGGAGGGGGISMDDIQGMGFATQQWVGENYLSIAFFSSLFKAYTSQMVEVVPNAGDVSTIENIKAMFGFWTEQYVSSLGYNSSGGGGGGGDLKLLLDNINDSNIGNIAPTASEVGKCLVYNGNNTWAWATPGGGGGGGGTITLTGDVTGTGTGTVATTIGAGRVTNSMLAGDIANDKLLHDTITIAGVDVALGESVSAYNLWNGMQNELNGRYVTLGTAQNITATKTFTASLIASNDIHLNKYKEQQWVVFNNNKKNFSFGQEIGGDCVLYAAGNVNFYTNVNGNPYALFVQGSSGNVGIGTNAPTNKLDVNGVAHVSNRIWSDVSIGARTSETEGFRFEWDANNNAVVVVKADGTPCNFYSMGGVSALGVGSSGTPSISAMNIGALTVSGKLTSRTAQVQNTLTVGSDNYEGNIVIEGNDGDDTYSSIIYQSGDILKIEADSSLDISGATSINGNTSITGTLYVSGTTSLHDMKVGSSGSVIKSITWNSIDSLLEVVIGSTIYSFQPVS